MACPPRVLVGALCVPCAEVLLLQASGGLVIAPHSPPNFPQFFAIGFDAPGLQSPPPMCHIALGGQPRSHSPAAPQPVGDGAGYGAFLKGLKDDLADRIEVDFVQCDGTDLEAVDQRAVGLQLVQQGLVKAVTFTAAGDMTVPGDMLRKKAVVLTQDLDADVLPRAAEAVPASEESRGVTALQDLALSAFQGDGAAPDAKATEAFLQRMDGLKAAGSAAILSNFADYSDLATYLDRSTPEPKGVVMDAAAVAKFFAEDYTDREGGLLGYLGCVDKAGLKLMVNPSTDAVEVEEDVRPLYDYLIKNGTICSM